MLLMSVVVFYNGMRFAVSRWQLIPLFAFSTLLAIGGLGLMRLRKWGWVLALAAAFVSMSMSTYFFVHVHDYKLLIPAFTYLVFFLYLIREDVRIRLR